MPHFGIDEEKQSSFFGVFLLFIGISGMIFSLIFDFFKTWQLSRFQSEMLFVPPHSFSKLAGC